MAAFTIESNVVVFNHPEYGARLLFTNGATNPRDKMGKNGITFHGFFTSFFYKTVPLDVTVIDEEGNQSQRVLRVNRSSLAKYIGDGADGANTDNDLVDALNQKLHDTGFIANQAAGEGLRHAGQHNRRSLRNTFSSFADYIRGSFLGLLYQNTIGGINRIRLRFLVVRTEKDILDAGETLAVKQFHDASQTVPAYKKHIQESVAETFADIPVQNKDNYIKSQRHDSDTHRHGKYPVKSKTDTSTGTTGKPTEWVRGEAELLTVKRSLQLAANIQFGNRPVTYINAFALGPWATGMTTYELMRESGSMFATGPDKDKILDKMLNIINYEKHQFDLALDTLMTKTPSLSGDDRALISKAVDLALKVALHERNANFNQILKQEFDQQGERAVSVFKKNKSAIQTMAGALNKEKQQIVIAGYPPFLKDLTDHAKTQGYEFKDFDALGVVGGQAISEAMRDQLVHHGFQQVYSSYGASDLDINLGVESDYEIAVRKAIEKNPALAQELYGKGKGLPMVFHYDPMNYHVECDKDDELIFTCARNDRSSPRIRYDLGDKGRVYASSDVQAVLAKYGIFNKPKTNLPLMFVWGRDSTVVFNGANLAFTELERAVTDEPSLETTVLKKAFYTYEDESGNEKLEIWLELNDGVALPDDVASNQQAGCLLKQLTELNQDFRYQIQHLSETADLPTVRFFKRGESPISEAGGHRKQVLIFQKKVNLPEDYVFPSQDKCLSVTIPSRLFQNEMGQSVSASGTSGL